MDNTRRFAALAIMIIMLSAITIATYWVYRMFGLIAVAALILFTVAGIVAWYLNEKGDKNGQSTTQTKNEK